MPERRNGFREFEHFAKSGRKKLDRNWGKREGCTGVMLWGLEEQVDLWLSRVLAGRQSRPPAQYAPAHPPDTEKRGRGGIAGPPTILLQHLSDHQWRSYMYRYFDRPPVALCIDEPDRQPSDAVWSHNNHSLPSFPRYLINSPVVGFHDPLTKRSTYGSADPIVNCYLTIQGSQCAATNKCHNTSCENELGCNKSCAAIITLVKSPAARLP